jgi:N-acyl-D-amino-acid deacylase
MLSHAGEGMIADRRARADVEQGVTLEIFGEFSWGPLSDAMKREIVELQADIRYPVDWTTFGEFFAWLARRGMSVNVASFVGAATVREVVLGKSPRAPDAAELDRMRELVRQAMREGALGLTTALIYVPGSYASTEELIALAKVAAELDGLFTVHMRSEGDRLLEAIDEVIRIARVAAIRTEIYHLKAAGRSNWGKLDAAVAKIEAARREGLPLTANMYTYIAGATGLDAAMPQWVQEGGVPAWAARLKDPATRARVRSEMLAPGKDWENLYLGAGADGVFPVAFKNPALRPLTGKSLAQIAAERNTTPEEVAMDLVIEDGTRVGTIYFLMSEDNVKKQIAIPWVSFGSDAEAPAPEGVFLTWNPHPRAYGNFARLLGKYVREEKVIPLEEAIRRLTSLPAANLRLAGRGCLAVGCFADVVVFDPQRIADHATFEKPHQLATGVKDVVVNGVPVLRDGEHTGATPGRFVGRSLGASAEAARRPSTVDGRP